MSRVHSSDDDEWDRFLAANPFGYHEQTSQYATLRETYGFQHDRAVVRDDQGQIIGGASGLFRRTPIGSLGVIERGPVARDDDSRLLEQVVDEVSALAKRHRLASIRVNTFENQAHARGTCKGRVLRQPRLGRRRDLRCVRPSAVGRANAVCHGKIRTQSSWRRDAQGRDRESGAFCGYEGVLRPSLPKLGTLCVSRFSNDLFFLFTRSLW